MRGMSTQPPPPPPPPPSPSASPGPAPSAPTPTYVTVDSPYEVANWRPLVHWLMYIPHGIVVYALQILSSLAFLVNWFIVLFTGKLNRGLYGAMLMYERYNTRSGYFLIGFTETYPPFDFDTGSTDNGALPPFRIDLPEPPPTVPRKHLFNFFLAIPHYFVIVLIGIGAYVVLIIGWFAVLFTGRWPKGMRDFLVRFTNYYYRVWTYVVMVDNRYPAFTLPA